MGSCSSRLHCQSSDTKYGRQMSLDVPFHLRLSCPVCCWPCCRGSQALGQCMQHLQHLNTVPLCLKILCNTNSNDLGSCAEQPRRRPIAAVVDVFVTVHDCLSQAAGMVYVQQHMHYQLRTDDLQITRYNIIRIILIFLFIESESALLNACTSE